MFASAAEEQSEPVTVKLTVATAVDVPSLPVIVYDEAGKAHVTVPEMTPGAELNERPEGNPGEIEYVTVPLT